MKREVEFEERKKTYLKAREVAARVPESVAEILRKLDEEWKTLFPQADYGEVSVTEVDPALKKEFNLTLESNYQNQDAEETEEIENLKTGDDVLHEWAAKEDSVYFANMAENDPRILNSNTDKGKGKPARIQGNFENVKLKDYKKRLKKFLRKLQKKEGNIAAIPTPYVNLYIAMTEQQMLFCDWSLALGTPEFTVKQKSRKQWQNFLDVDQSVKTGTAVLPYDSFAVEVLERNKASGAGEQTQERKQRDFAKGLKLWNITEDELAYIYGDEERSSFQLSPPQGKRFFETILKRGFDPEWKVVDTMPGSSLDVDPASRQVKFPPDRVLVGDEIIYIVAHELLVHATRRDNGAKQDLKLLATGTEGYLLTEEGLATLMEMIMGQEFGHRRQVVLAARYHAIAMSLEVRQDELGKFVPAHTIQEIYNTLRDYGVSQKDAQNLVVWRNVRGTSLKRQVVNLPIGKKGEFIRVVETFVKDAVYFEGWMKMMDYLMKNMPIAEQYIQPENAQVQVSGQVVKDFNDDVLAAVGEGVRSMDDQFRDYQQTYEAMVQLGRETLLRFIEPLLAGGKMTFEELMDPAWQAVLNYAGSLKPVDVMNAPLLKKKTAIR